MNAEGKIYLQDTELELPDLAPKLAAISDNKLDRRIFVRGDKGVPYGRIMEVMAHHHPGRLHQGGAAGRTDRRHDPHGPRHRRPHLGPGRSAARRHAFGPSAAAPAPSLPPARAGRAARLGDRR